MPSDLGRKGVSSRFQIDLVALVPRLRRFAYALSGSTDAGDDLVQAACERALKNAAQFQPGTRLDSWMFRIVQNLWLDAKRRDKVRGTAVDPDEARLSDSGSGARLAEDRITLARVRDGMEELPAEQRLVLVLVAIEGRSYREVAEMTGVPVGTVMSRLSRARGRLAPLIADTPNEARRWTQ